MNLGDSTAVPGSPPPQQDPWQQVVLKLRPNLTFETRVINGSTQVVIEDVVRGKFFQVGGAEHEIVASIDGKRSIEQIVQALEGSSANASLDPNIATAAYKAGMVAQWLVQSNLAYSDAMDSSARLDTQQRSLAKAKWMGLLNPISMKTKLFNPNSLLDRVQPYFNWSFHYATLAIWIALATMAMWIVGTRWSDIQSASVGVLSGQRWAWMLAMWLILKVVHEMAHGIACKRYGGDVPEAGVLLLLFTPMAYVNVTSMWRFSNRWHRIIVAAAGMYVELLISFGAIIVWDRYSGGLLGDIAFQVFLMASVTTILFNANPLMRFDGYFILSDLLHIPNLYTKGTRWFGDKLKSLFFGLPAATGICASHEQPYVSVYGSLAFFWKISISVGLVIASSVLFQGAGIVLAFAGVILWFGMPILQQYQSMFGPNAKHPIDRRRTTLSCGLTLLFVVGMFTFLRAPSIKSAPAIVQFRDETIVRAGADGFIKQILVENGDSVRQGDTLIVLHNPELTLEVGQLRHQAEETRIQARIHQQKHETSLAQSLTEKHLSLLEQASEKQKQADGLVVRAAFDGFVFHRGLENSIGNFSKRGAALMTMARRQTKEIIVSVDQQDMESLQQNQGQPIRVVMPGASVFDSQLIKIDPTASTRPSHMSLCAHVNGPLPVQAASNNSSANNDGPTMELLSPRLTAKLGLSQTVSTQLQSGQIGRAFFQARSQSLGSYLWLGVSEWLETQLKQAAETAIF